MVAVRSLVHTGLLLAILTLIPYSVHADDVVLPPDPLYTDFHKACDECDFRKAESLFDSMLAAEKFSKIDKFDRAGFAPLTYAARSGCLSIVTFLVQKTAKVDARPDVKHLTPLMYAAEQNHASVVEYLLAHGADVNAQYGVKRTPLSAAMMGSEDSFGPDGSRDKTLIALLDHGADINALDDNGATALITAVRWGDKELVRFLIDRGANVWVNDKSHKTAADYAIDDHQLEVLGMLETKGVHNVKAK